MSQLMIWMREMTRKEIRKEIKNKKMMTKRKRK
jgi:hypothetical protein